MQLAQKSSIALVEKQIVNGLCFVRFQTYWYKAWTRSDSTSVQNETKVAFSSYMIPTVLEYKSCRSKFPIYN